MTCVTCLVTISSIIKSFKHKGIEDFFYTGNKKGIRPEHAGRLELILDRLNAANEVRDMNYPGSNLHKLTGDKKTKKRGLLLTLIVLKQGENIHKKLSNSFQ